MKKQIKLILIFILSLTLSLGMGLSTYAASLDSNIEPPPDIPIENNDEKVEEAKEEDEKVEEEKVEEAKEEEPKVEEPKAEEPKEEEPKAEEPKVEEPKEEEPKAEEPKADEPKVEEPKADEPKVEEPKAEEPKVEETKVEEPKPEEPKIETTIIKKIIDINANLKVADLSLTNEDTLNYEIILTNDGDFDLDSLTVSDRLGLYIGDEILTSGEERAFEGSYDIDRFNELEEIENIINIRGQVEGREVDLSLAFIAQVEIIKGSITIKINDLSDSKEVFDVFIEGDNQQSGSYTLSLKNGEEGRIDNLWLDEYKIKPVTPMNYSLVKESSVNLNERKDAFVEVSYEVNNKRWFTSKDSIEIKEIVNKSKRKAKVESTKSSLEEKLSDSYYFEIFEEVPIEEEVVEPEVPVVPETPETPETPEAPEEPEIPEVPETPEEPEELEEPEEPEVPEESDTPIIPDESNDQKDDIIEAKDPIEEVKIESEEVMDLPKEITEIESE